MTPRRPPLLVLADMKRAGIEPPVAGHFLGTRLEDGGRIVVWKVGDATVEQRVPILNTQTAIRRNSFKIVR